MGSGARKRLFNNRPMCFAAAFLTLGIAIAELLYGHNNLFRLIPLLIGICATAGFLIFKNTRRFAYLALLFVVGIIAMGGANDVYSSRLVDAEYDVTYQGTVASEIVFADGKTTFYVEDVILNGERLDGKTYVNVYQSFEPDFGAGDTVRLHGSFSSFEHIRFDTYYAWSQGKKIYYYSEVSDVDKLSDGKPTFPLNLQLAVKRMFYENTDEDTAAICQGLILGDKRGMDESLYNNVKDSGMAHVLAVSGLHVTALATAVYWLLKKLKVNGKLSFAIVLILTFLYAMLCSFTPSVLRAFIMTAVLNFASAFGLKRDGLSSLSFACIALLLINPVTLLDVGYLLSVFSILGLILFYRPIYEFGMKCLDKISPEKHRGKVVVGSISTSLAANVITPPLIGCFFGSVPILFVLSGLIILPYLMFIWLILLINTAFALITTLWGSVGLMDFLVLPFTAWVRTIGNITWASTSAEIGGAIGVVLIVFWVFSALLFSRHVFLTPSKKGIVFSVCSAICLCASLVIALA